MNIILLKDVDKVGDKHEVVSVKPGYARNYLIPNELAIIASKSNLKTLGHLQRREEQKELEKLSEYQAVLDSFDGKILKIGAKAGAEGKIFGSVTTLQIAQALKDQLDTEIPRKKIELPEEVKTLGSYTALIKFHKEAQGNIAFEVVQE
ncbi:50S ribosomal protein L9 [Membranihabitans maritimus]|uniref:50S ribosomal protein L9 n=1 Tax=Membranihabitans maritimus TaxID=2904244 RepID=UPI001F00B9EB|nr:50S ribosomal protein L9 [Membranihabitans maritimus]